MSIFSASAEEAKLDIVSSSAETSPREPARPTGRRGALCTRAPSWTFTSLAGSRRPNLQNRYRQVAVLLQAEVRDRALPLVGEQSPRGAPLRGCGSGLFVAGEGADHLVLRSFCGGRGLRGLVCSEPWPLIFGLRLWLHEKTADDAHAQPIARRSIRPAGGCCGGV